MTTCSTCGAVIEDERHVHKFINGDRKVVATFCDDCCPRCWAGRREATPA